MCVIIYKPKGVDMPSRSILNKAYSKNPHGCGYVATGSSYKTCLYRDFLKRLGTVGKDENCIIHFRLATHGSICTENCHPFNIGDVYFAHNGILNIKPKADMTDSETAFKQIIYPAITQYGLDSIEVNDVIAGLIGFSKFAIMQNNNVRLYGDYRKIKGIYYSNLRFIGL